MPDELIAHLSPIAWESVNFLGQFTFEPDNARPLEDRRPLRSGAFLPIKGYRTAVYGCCRECRTKRARERY